MMEDLMVSWPRLRIPKVTLLMTLMTLGNVPALLRTVGPPLTLPDSGILLPTTCMAPTLLKWAPFQECPITLILSGPTPLVIALSTAERLFTLWGSATWQRIKIYVFLVHG